MGEAFLRSKTIQVVNRISGSITDLIDLRNSSEIIDNSIESIDASKMTSMPNLTKLYLPKCVSVGSNAFYYCSKLSYVRLGGCTLYPNAFDGCQNLRTVIVEGLSASFIYYPFTYGGVSRDLYLLTKNKVYTSIDPSVTFSDARITNIYVPENLYSEYMNDPNWYAMSNKVHIYDGGTI